MNDHEPKLLTRRDVLKLAGVGAGGLVLRPVSALTPAKVVAENEVAILYDASKCVGCRACEEACRECNSLPIETVPPSNLSATTWNLIKKREEAAKQYEEAGRADSAQKERDEGAIIKGYLPPQLGEDEIRAAAREVISQVGAQDLKGLGKVMGADQF